jgi:hypothetical protein
MRSAVLGLATLCWSSGVLAQPTPFPLELQAPTLAGCPTPEELEQALRERDLRFRAPATGERATSLRIEVTPREHRVLGVLELRLLEGEPTRRELLGASCEEVVRSLVLVVALALLPLASPAPATSSPSALPPPRPPPLPSPPPLAPRPAPSARWTTGAEVAVMNGLGPRLSPGLGLWLQRAWGPWSARLGGGYWPHGATSAGPFRAEFLAALLDASFCRRVTRTSELELAACATLQAGRLKARGLSVEEPRAEQRPWVAPRAGGRLTWAPPTGGLVEAHVGLFSPIFRDTFRFETPQVQVHQAPVLGFWGSVGGGFAFP